MRVVTDECLKTGADAYSTQEIELKATLSLRMGCLET